MLEWDKFYNFVTDTVISQITSRSASVDNCIEFVAKQQEKERWIPNEKNDICQVSARLAVCVLNPRGMQSQGGIRWIPSTHPIHVHAVG
jgi:hypothetical protein